MTNVRIFSKCCEDKRQTQKGRYVDIMEKIASFTIDHIKLLPGLYVSRKDHVGLVVITTFDIRMTKPNGEPVMKYSGGSYDRASRSNISEKR